MLRSTLPYVRGDSRLPPKLRPFGQLVVRRRFSFPRNQHDMKDVVTVSNSSTVQLTWERLVVPPAEVASEQVDTPATTTSHRPGDGIRIFLQSVEPDNNIQPILLDPDVANAEIWQTERDHRRRQHAAKVQRSLQLKPAPLNILYQDQALLMVDKPGSVLTVPGVRQHAHSLLQQVHEYAKHTDGLPDNATTHRIVHRLDMDTSGCVVFGRSLAVTQQLQALFRNKQQSNTNSNDSRGDVIEKEYVAVVAGHWALPSTTGIIDLPLQRDVEHAPFMRVSTPAYEVRAHERLKELHRQGQKKQWTFLQPKPSVTRFTVLYQGWYHHSSDGQAASVTRVTTDNDDDSNNEDDAHHRLPFSVLRLEPITGRTHQLRVHMAALGYPIIGDPTYGWYGEAAVLGGLYGVPRRQKASNAAALPSMGEPPSPTVLQAWNTVHPPNIAPLCLHARSLTLTHPITGQPLHVTTKEVPFATQFAMHEDDSCTFSKQVFRQGDNSVWLRTKSLSKGLGYRTTRLGMCQFSSTTPPPSKSPPKTTTVGSGRSSTTKDEAVNDDSTTNTSDPPIWTVFDKVLPDGWKPYARLARMDKPIGTWLLLWPCAWSTALAHPPTWMDHVALLTLFGIGAFTMRGAGCTINDLWDQDIDKEVARTQQRPLAAGDLTTRQGVQFLALQMAVGAVVLVSLPHTWYCFQWGVASLPLVFLYPTTKRYFPYPQLVLGLCFNWGAWMGWAATYGSMDWATVAPLYISGVTWTLIYDTIYAHQDKADDKKLGLHSTALSFGSDEEGQRQILHGLAVTTLLLWSMAGYQAEMVNPGLFQTGVLGAYAHLVWQIQTADLTNPHNLAARFRSNATTGALVYGSLLVGHPPSMFW